MSDESNAVAAKPARKRARGTTVRVYRCQLVEERVLAVASARATSSGEAAGILRRFLDHADREHFVVLLLDAAGSVLGVHTVAIGSHDRVVVTVREVFKAAILHNADRVVVAHNHPSGPVTPSKEDNRLTRDLVRASKLLGIEIADHVIVGRGAFWSFRDHGQL